MPDVNTEEATRRAGGLVVNILCILLAIPLIGDLLGMFVAARMFGAILVASNQRLKSLVVLAVIVFAMFPCSYIILFVSGGHPSAVTGIAMFIFRFLVARVGIAALGSWMSPEAAKTLG